MLALGGDLAPFFSEGFFDVLPGTISGADSQRDAELRIPEVRKLKTYLSDEAIQSVNLPGLIAFPFFWR